MNASASPHNPFRASTPPTFSVVIPFYNCHDYLAETIDSILAQTFPAAEILVVDDGSPIGPTPVLARFGDRVRLICKANGGVSSARNLGAAEATSSWVAFMDHDDVWAPDHLARHAAIISADPTADLVYSARCLLTRTDPSEPFVLSEPHAMPHERELPAVLLHRCAFTPSAVTVRRSAFLEAGSFDSRFDTAEDWELWLRLQRLGAKFVYSPEPTLHYRVHGNSITYNVLPVFRRNLEVVEKAILPYLPPLRRVAHKRRIISRLEAEAAILLREVGLPGALPMMFRSLRYNPFQDIRRYKILARMLLSAPKARHSAGEGAVHTI